MASKRVKGAMKSLLFSGRRCPRNTKQPSQRENRAEDATVDTEDLVRK